MSTNVPQNSIQKKSQVNQADIANSLTNTNDQAIMGKTVFNTVNLTQSQMSQNKNLDASLQSQQSKNSFEKEKTITTQVKPMNNIRNTGVPISNTPNRTNASQVPKKVTAFQQSAVPAGKSKFAKTIMKNGKQLKNIDLNDEVEESQILGASNNNISLSNYPTTTSVKPQNQQNNLASTVKSQNQNLPTLSQQIKPSVVQSVHPQNESIQRGSVQQVQSVHNASALPQNQSIQRGSVQQVQSVHNGSIQQVQSVHNASALPQNQSIQRGSVQQVQSVHNASALPQNQSIQRASVKPLQSVHNQSVHPQNQSIQIASVKPLQSVHNQSVHPQQSMHNGSVQPVQSVHNQGGNPQQSMYNLSIYPQNKPVNNASVQSHLQSVHNSNVNPQQSTNLQNNPPPNQSNMNSTVFSTQILPRQSQAQNQNQSIQQMRASGRDPLNQNTNSQIRKSGKEPERNELTQSAISRKSSLKASRNKSPPQLIRESNGKIKRTNTDCSGNSFYMVDDEEKIMSDNNICNHLDAYLNKEIVNTMYKEPKPQNNKKGNGFRYYGQLTKAGRNQNGKTKIDQDTPLVHLNVGGVSGFNLFGVLDGHGQQGHFVSQYCRDYFIRVMDKYAQLCIRSKLTTADAIYKELKRTNYAYIIDAFNKADVHMEIEKKFDYSFSGTTCNIVFQFNKYLVCASVGDSRGILVYDEGDHQNKGIFELSHDHKPDLPGEIERIFSSGGMVEQMKDPEGNLVGPPRVWKAGCTYPGLAMSRSLGDFQGKEAGVIATPEIIEYTIHSPSKYMVICSDGVWEFIKNEQVRDMGNAFLMKNDVGGFCTELVKFAVHSWEQFDIIRDDITVVCVFF